MPNKLTPYHATLEQAMKADAHRIKQNRRTSKALFEQIKADGYAGSYSRVTDFRREWHGREGNAPKAFVPLSLAGRGLPVRLEWETHIQKFSSILGKPVESIKETPVKGLYEVYSKGKIVYVNKHLKYVFSGSMFEIDNKRNLTQDRLGKLTEVRINLFPTEHALISTRGNGRRRIAVFFRSKLSVLQRHRKGTCCCRHYYNLHLRISRTI